MRLHKRVFLIPSIIQNDVDWQSIEIVRLELVQEGTDRQRINVAKIGKEGQFFGDRIQRP